MVTDTSGLKVRLAMSEADVAAAQRLRYRVFVEELGGVGAMVDHDAKREIDRFDTVCDHLLLCDSNRPEGEEVVGIYRLMRGGQAEAFGQFYCDDEYDLTPLRQSGRRLLELGRSCLAPEYRGGAAMHQLWRGLGTYVAEHRIEILFGVASFHGTDVDALAAPLTWLHHNHLVPEALRVRARAFQKMDLMPIEQVDRKAAMLAMPALIKAYLRLGGTVGEGAFVDHDFNTTDVCLVMDTARMTDAADRYRV